jgi:hypothetical protein
VAGEKKNLQTLVDQLVLQAMAGLVMETQNQEAKPRLQRVEESPRATVPPREFCDKLPA